MVILIVLSITEGCQVPVKKTIEMEYPSWTSPDGKAIIYQSHFEENKSINISLSTWIETGFFKGGGGIFTCQNYRLDTVQVNWTSDSSAVVEYPKTATVIRNELKTYFAGRAIHLTYKPVTY